MHILYFHQYFSTPEGSTGLRSYYMARALVRRGHTVTVVTGKYDRSSLPLPNSKTVKQTNIEGIKVVCVPVSASNKDNFNARIYSFLKYVLYAFVVALQKPADLTLATSTPLTTAIPAILISKIMRIPFLFEARDLWPDAAIEVGALQHKFAIKTAKWLEHNIYRQAAECIGLAPETTETMKKRGASSTIFIPNGAFCATYKGKSSRFESHLPFNCLYAGTLGFVNEVEILIDVARACLSKGMNDVKFTIIGDGAKYKYIKQAISRYNLHNCTLIAAQKNDNLGKYMKTAHAGLLLMKDIASMRKYSSPNKFSLYLSAGLPVLLNYEGWMANLVRQYQCGFVVEHTCIESYVHAIKQLKSDKTQYQRMSANAARLCRNNFDLYQLTHKFTETVEKHG